MDEIVIEVKRSTDESTKVVVGRRVIKAIPGRRDRQWRTAKSNGEVERWVLTQIEDELAVPGTQAAAAPASTKPAAPKPPAAPETPSVGANDEAEIQLRKFRDLRDKGLISEDEYQAMRKRFLEILVAASPPKNQAPSGLTGTYIGVITGDAGGQRVNVPVTFAVMQNGDEVAGTWTGAGGLAGTISGVLNGSTISPFRAIQVSPCRGEFIGVTTVEGNFARLRGAYTGQDCNGPVSAFFTADRQ